MRFCVSPFKLSNRRYSGWLCMLLLLAGCGQQEVDYRFAINQVSIRPADQLLTLRFQQELSLSQQAREALRHGVSLTIRLDMELRHGQRSMVIEPATRLFQIRYLSLSERYQLLETGTDKLQTFPRLRHALAAIGDVNIQLRTARLVAGRYELRARIRVDKGRLPAPMQLPTWLSSEWQHDSEWSVWPFEINV